MVSYYCHGVGYMHIRIANLAHAPHTTQLTGGNRLQMSLKCLRTGRLHINLLLFSYSLLMQRCSQCILHLSCSEGSWAHSVTTIMLQSQIQHVVSLLTCLPFMQRAQNLQVGIESIIWCIRQAAICIRIGQLPQHGQHLSGPALVFIDQTEDEV